MYSAKETFQQLRNPILSKCPTITVWGVPAPGRVTFPDLFWAHSLPDAAGPHAWRFQPIMEFKVFYLDYFT